MTSHRLLGISGLTLVVSLSVAGCEGSDEDGLTTSNVTDPALQPSPELGFVMRTGTEQPAGLEGGVVGEVVEVDGCLGFTGTDERGVLSLPPETDAIANGARLTDGTEFVVGDVDVFVGGMWIGPEDPLYPTDDQDCVGESVLWVFHP